VKLGKAVSWLVGTLQLALFPRLEECWKTPLTTKEQQLATILEMIQKIMRPELSNSESFQAEPAGCSGEILAPLDRLATTFRDSLSRQWSKMA
jgi:hypothetical protein